MGFFFLVFFFASRELDNGRLVWFGLVWFGFITGQERIGIWGDTDTTQTQTEGDMTEKKRMGWTDSNGHGTEETG